MANSSVVVVAVAMRMTLVDFEQQLGAVVALAN